MKLFSSWQVLWFLIPTMLTHEVLLILIGIISPIKSYKIKNMHIFKVDPGNVKWQEEWLHLLHFCQGTPGIKRKWVAHGK